MPHHRQFLAGRALVEKNFNAIKSLVYQANQGRFGRSITEEEAINKIVSIFFSELDERGQKDLAEKLQRGHYNSLRKLFNRDYQRMKIAENPIQWHIENHETKTWHTNPRAFSYLSTPKKLFLLCSNLLQLSAVQVRAQKTVQSGTVSSSSEQDRESSVENTSAHKKPEPAAYSFGISASQSTPAAPVQWRSSIISPVIAFSSVAMQIGRSVGGAGRVIWERFPTFLPDGAVAQKLHLETIGERLDKSPELREIYNQAMEICDSDEKKKLEIILEKNYELISSESQHQNSKHSICYLRHLFFKRETEFSFEEDEVDFSKTGTTASIGLKLRAFQMGASIMLDIENGLLPQKLRKPAFEFLDFALRKGVKHAAVVRLIYLRNTDYQVTLGEFERSSFSNIVDIFVEVETSRKRYLLQFAENAFSALKEKKEQDQENAEKYDQEIQKWRDAIQAVQQLNFLEDFILFIGDAGEAFQREPRKDIGRLFECSITRNPFLMGKIAIAISAVRDKDLAKDEHDLAATYIANRIALSLRLRSKSGYGIGLITEYLLHVKASDYDGISTYESLSKHKYSEASVRGIDKILEQMPRASGREKDIIKVDKFRRWLGQKEVMNNIPEHSVASDLILCLKDFLLKGPNNFSQLMRDMKKMYGSTCDPGNGNEDNKFITWLSDRLYIELDFIRANVLLFSSEAKHASASAAAGISVESGSYSAEESHGSHAPTVSGAGPS
jgi:hypothetical protein